MTSIDKNVRVLVAEDEAINRLYIVSLLEARGFECVAVRNGKEAVEAFRRQGFDIVLMDLGLPVLSGVEASRQIREIELGTESRAMMAALTAHDTLEDRRAAQNAGIDEFIIKPFSEIGLIETVELMVSRGKG
ncbi:MAG TPA: response regulator [Spirochaetia bacterium]|nr:response regulator [Spirochaetia bacterium]